MILDTPTEEEFAISGVSFLNLAWDAAICLLLDLDETPVDDLDDDGSVTDAYWQLAQRPLATSVTLAQQGAEFLIKSRIATISPFLLLSGQPKDWPRSSDKSDVSFADFRTLDAQDLLRVHDTVVPQRVSDGFRVEFDRMRKVRNSVIHTVDRRHRFAAQEVLKWVLRIHKELAAEKPWPIVRAEYFDSADPGGAFWSEYGWEQRVAREVRAALDALSPADAKELLGITSKKQRFYYCTNCYIRDFGLESHVKTAQLRPNSPKSTAAFCYACQLELRVRRVNCKHCPGNVIEDEDGNLLHCLSCGGYQNELGYSRRT